ncbi:uncharacterized protein BO95DRAFT_454999 [Aspergillus brunneoviolaceus CBS 621.78]|uniref:Uncharacterized protein n=1 Tax=Aspergillus brunneoviolaceus CBS 621.78 TaxID=1450534 RepID=A0ACD1G2T3_9EURO|nr:hypothetical protein BO95DRAFT_454999 [Aspergillus brunneoviolaceus CBS 621.78]RAH43492.1 hypothetical protein BO95DRAFT_454999 [Aspergillus brunneoviolaceus CBS 621.78]
MRALKIISWQIANADPAYRKDLSSVDMTSTSDLEILWNRLFVKSYATDSCFFMLLDGLEQLDKGEVGQLLALLVKLHTTSTNWGKFQLHILLMGQDETMIIGLKTKSAQDMKKFIESRVDRLDIFGGSSEQVVSIRRETLETLMREDQGDFVSTGLPLTLGELESVLSLKGREQSLRPLSNVIIDHKEFDLKSRVLLVSDSVRHFLDTPVKDGTGMESKVWDEVEAVNESGSVCDASLFQRFGFEDFFVAKLSRSSLKVRVDVESAHCKILKACLEAICSPDKPEMDFLLDYAMSIGPYLVALFDDVEIIERRWSTGYTSVSKLRQVWFYKDTLVHTSRPISGAVGPTGLMRMTSMCAKLAQVCITTKPARTNCGRGRSQWRSAAMIKSYCMFRPMIPSPKRGSAKAMSAWAGKSSVSRHGLSGLDRNGG